MYISGWLPVVSILSCFLSELSQVMRVDIILFFIQDRINDVRDIMSWRVMQCSNSPR